MKKTLKNPKYWLYRGKCRNCSNVTDWVVDKKMEWLSFYRVTRDNHFPSFVSHCEHCKNEAVFDLLAMSASES